MINETVARLFVNLLEVVLKWIHPSDWHPGSPPVSSRRVVVAYSTSVSEIPDRLYEALEELKLDPVRLELHARSTQTAVEKMFIEEAGDSWAAILVDDPSEPSEHVAFAFREFAHKRPAIVTVVAGGSKNSFPVLDRYIHLEVVNSQHSIRQATAEALMSASLARVRHYKRISKAAYNFLAITAIVLIFMSLVFGWWFARNRARAGLDDVRNFDSALVSWHEQSGLDLERAILAANDDDWRNSQACTFSNGTKPNWVLKLIEVEFVDHLVMSEHRWGTLCQSSSEYEYVQTHVNDLLGATLLSKASFDSDVLPFLTKIMNTANKPHKRQNAQFVPCVGVFTVEDPKGSPILIDKKKLDLGELGKHAVSGGQGSVLFLVPNAQVVVSDTTLFEVKGLSRAPSSRLCGLK